MTDFGTRMREWADELRPRPQENGPDIVKRPPTVADIKRLPALANLAAQLEETLEKIRTAKVHTHGGHVISSAPDCKWRFPDCPSCRLVIQADVALAACKEFMDRYE